MLPEPTILDLIDASQTAIQGVGDETADFVRGSDYESLVGPTAMIWSRETQRDTDLFRAIRFNDSQGNDLTKLAFKRFGIPRVLLANGQGTASLARPTTTAGAGVIWQGTRITLLGGALGTSTSYRVAADTPVGSATLSLNVPIEAVQAGSGVAVAVAGGACRIDDELWDDTWAVKGLTCADGTDLEDAETYRDRIRSTRKSQRVGHVAAIVQACMNAGAGTVVTFPSNYGGSGLDYGLNVCYVGDSGYSGSPSLVEACRSALQGFRVLGDCLQIFPLRRTVQDVIGTVTLNVPPTSLDIPRLTLATASAIRQYMGGAAGAFTFSRTGLLGVLAKASGAITGASFSEPTADAQILVSGNFPAVLNRYVPGNIALTFTQ